MEGDAKMKINVSAPKDAECGRESMNRKKMDELG